MKYTFWYKKEIIAKDEKEAQKKEPEVPLLLSCIENNGPEVEDKEDKIIGFSGVEK